MVRMKQRQTVSSSLTDRQRQVLELVAKGHTNAEIGEVLGISSAGAKWHVGELLMKFDAESREELVEKWAAETSARARFAAIGTGFLGLLQPKFAAMAGGALVAVGGGVTVLAMAFGNNGRVEEPAHTDATATPSVPASLAWQGFTDLSRFPSRPPSDIYWLGSLNGDDSKGTVEATLRSPNTLCIAASDAATQSSVASCDDPAHLVAQAGTGGTAILVSSPNGPSTGIREVRAFLVLPSDVERVAIISETTEVLSLEPHVGPTAFGLDLKFAYAGFAPVDLPFTVITYDATGVELGRWVEDPPDILDRGPKNP